MFFNNIHLSTVLIAAVAGVGVGFGWHAQWAFGKLWIQEKMKGNASWQGSMIKPMLPSYISISISTLITAFVLGALFSSLVITNVGGIIFTAFLLWIGLMVPIKLSDYLFGGETFRLFLINAGYMLAEVTVMSLIIGLWS